MDKIMFDATRYEAEIRALFQRFPSVQNVPFGEAYKPGLERMEAFAERLGHPERRYQTLHVAGTNGKGSVSSMLASVLMAKGYKTGLYTSPHLIDFRERMKVDGQMPPREWVYAFIERHRADFEELSLSFFEITTGMAFQWFADAGCDWAVIEVGLGGRLDSTNIITPRVSIVTSIGLDHCQYLGNTLAAIAGEKAGIFKPGVPAVVGEFLPETEPVFREKALGPLYAAQDAVLPPDILPRMDLKGDCQAANLRTVLTTLRILKMEPDFDAIAHTAARTGLRGRWEILREKPLVIADIGHNAAALKGNFRQLEDLHRPLSIVYAVMADKDLEAILPLMPRRARYFFATPATPRALPSGRILEAAAAFRGSWAGLTDAGTVAHAVELALESAGEDSVIYIGGSTFAVAEAINLF